MQELGEGKYSDHAAEGKHKKHGHIEFGHGLHYVVVFSKNQQDEAAGDAGEYHSADGQSAADE